MNYIGRTKNNMSKNISILVCVLLLAAMLFSAVFIAEKSGHHDCTGRDCPICETIQICVNNIRICGGAAVTICVVSAFCLFIENILVDSIYDISIPTLVKYKVRLDN